MCVAGAVRIGRCGHLPGASSLPFAACPAIGWHAPSPCLLWRWGTPDRRLENPSPVPRSLAFLSVPKRDDNRVQLATQRAPVGRRGGAGGGMGREHDRASWPPPDAEWHAPDKHHHAGSRARVYASIITYHLSGGNRCNFGGDPTTAWGSEVCPCHIDGGLPLGQPLVR